MVKRCFEVFPAFGLTSAPCSDLLAESFHKRADQGAASRRLWPHYCPRGTDCSRDALMKTSHRNLPAETDAEMRAFIFDFATQRQRHTPHRPRVRRLFEKGHKIL
jgi:hypothetical protein